MKQGSRFEPGPHRIHLDYYGRPTLKQIMLRYEYGEEQRFNRWTAGAVSGRYLGVQPSKKFAVYAFYFVPAHYSREEAARHLRAYVPPSDDFYLDFANPPFWALERVELPLKMPLVLPERQSELILLETEAIVQSSNQTY